MTNLLPTLTVFSLIGLIEWFLALARTLSVVHRFKPFVLVPLLTFLETGLALLVFQRFIQQGDWTIALAYSLGSAAGSVLPMLFIKGDK